MDEFFIQKLKEAIQRSKLSQAEFARRAGISAGYLTDILKGRTSPSQRVLAGICLAHSLESLWEEYGDGSFSDWPEGHMERRVPSGVSAKIKARENQKKVKILASELNRRERFEGCVLIPRYDVTASAGAGAAVAYENEVDRMAFSEDWLKVEMGVSPSSLVLITTSGDSMEPTLRPGDLLLLDTSVTELRENAIYAVQVGGSLLVKRIQKRMDGSVLIKSDNPAYETEEIRGELTEGVKIVGKLIWAGKRF